MTKSPLTKGASALKSWLANFGLILAAFNVVINILDLVTTFIGFSRGMPEQNGMASLFMNIVGNEYVGAVVIKGLLIAMFIFAYRAIRAVERGDVQRTLKVVLSLLLLDSVLTLLAAYILTTVLGNFIAIGWV